MLVIFLSHGDVAARRETTSRALREKESFKNILFINCSVLVYDNGRKLCIKENIMTYRIQTFNQWADVRKNEKTLCASSQCSPSQSRGECVQCYETYVKKCLPSLLDQAVFDTRFIT